MANFGVVDILKIGLAGLVFLLAYMSYRLMRQFQDKGHDSSPDNQALKLIKNFLWMSIALVVIVGGFSVAEAIIKQADPREIMQECRDSLERLDTYARSPHISLVELKSIIITHSQICTDNMRKLDVN